ncbi:MAG: 8-amino-7-oxononanoate synthase [Gammaproteobacteria bacterium]|nr:8-amino-7-oxononanoate synthase [Gammaproteobacteria bacterium]
MSLIDSLSESLEQKKSQGLYRHRRIVSSPQGAEIVVDGQFVLSFCSNDYLGLANHPDVITALQEGATTYGVGSGASHLVTGHSSAHHELENALAKWTGRERVLLFSSGYMANIGVISALCQRNDLVLQDRLNHASLLDGARLSGAQLKRYAHNDSDALARRLVKYHGSALVVSDGVFSMDGDVAPLPKIAALVKMHDAVLMVDDAHGFGVLGQQGRGVVDHSKLNNNDVPILVGTLGKSFGTFGAFVAGSELLIETLIQQARSYIYTTAIPPAVAYATLTSLELLKRDDWRRDHLQMLIAHFRQRAAEAGLPLSNSKTAIQPLIVGDSKRAIALSEALLKRGILVSAIRPPTVPKGTARLRVTLCATHTKDHVGRLLDMLLELWKS